jgi:hypothetical protein
VLLATDVLPGLSVKFQPGLGIPGPEGDINQATVELSYKGKDWSASSGVRDSFAPLFLYAHAAARLMLSLPVLATNHTN